MEKPDDQAEWITGKGKLNIAGIPVEVEITVPAKPVRVRRMLPILQKLTDVVVGVAVNTAQANGEKISCAKGCGACCRQLVPIAESEAYHLLELVIEMTEQRRAAIRTRFAKAKARLEQAGLFDKILFPGELNEEDRRQLGLQYFHLGIACPFLEDESCSIHPDRPLACREYLVTSPVENCARPSAETVQCVEMPGSVSRAVRAINSSREINWLPLILALDWAAEQSDESSLCPGTEWIGKIFTQLTQK